MINKPDSILDAVKKTAVALDLPWSDLQKVYRDLQDDDPSSHSAWIPKSRGRTIWNASPNYIARFITAIAFRGSQFNASEAIYLAHGLSAPGYHPAASLSAPIESVFSRFLTNSEEAGDLRAIEFSPSEKRISFILSDGRIDLTPSDPDGTANPSDDFHDKAVRAAIRKASDQRVATNTVIQGSAIVEIAETVLWRDESVGQPPFSNSKEAQAS